jgi:uncharacterized protein
MPDMSPCVHCRRRPAQPDWRPFCSERCKMADLAHWLRGDYRIPDGPVAADDEDSGSAPSRTDA